MDGLCGALGAFDRRLIWKFGARCLECWHGMLDRMRHRRDNISGEHRIIQVYLEAIQIKYYLAWLHATRAANLEQCFATSRQRALTTWKEGYVKSVARTSGAREECLQLQCILSWARVTVGSGNESEHAMPEASRDIEAAVSAAVRSRVELGRSLDEAERFRSECKSILECSQNAEAALNAAGRASAELCKSLGEAKQLRNECQFLLEASQGVKDSLMAAQHAGAEIAKNLGDAGRLPGSAKLHDGLSREIVKDRVLAHAIRVMKLADRALLRVCLVAWVIREAPREVCTAPAEWEQWISERDSTRSHLDEATLKRAEALQALHDCQGQLNEANAELESLRMKMRAHLAEVSQLKKECDNMRCCLGESELARTEIVSAFRDCQDRLREANTELETYRCKTEEHLAEMDHLARDRERMEGRLGEAEAGRAETSQAFQDSQNKLREVSEELESLRSKMRRKGNAMACAVRRIKGQKARLVTRFFLAWASASDSARRERLNLKPAGPRRQSSSTPQPPNAESPALRPPSGMQNLMMQGHGDLVRQLAECSKYCSAHQVTNDSERKRIRPASARPPNNQRRLCNGPRSSSRAV